MSLAPETPYCIDGQPLTALGLQQLRRYLEDLITIDAVNEDVRRVVEAESPWLLVKVRPTGVNTVPPRDPDDEDDENEDDDDDNGDEEPAVIREPDE